MLSNSYSAEYGGLAGVIVSTKRGANQFHGTSFYDFNSNELNALHLRADAERRVARRSQRRHARPSLRRQPRRADRDEPDVLLRQLRRQQAEGARRRRAGAWCRPRPCAAAISRARSFVVRDPLHRRAVPGQPHSRPIASIRPRAASWTSSTRCRTSRRRRTAASATFREILPLERNRDRADGRIDHELTAARLAVRARQLAAPRPRRASRSRAPAATAAPGSRTSACSTAQSKAITLADGLDARSGRTRSSTSSAAATASTTRNRQSQFVAGDVGSPVRHRGAARWPQRRPGFRSSCSPAPNRPSDIRDQRQNTFRDLRPVLVLAEQHHDLARGARTRSSSAASTRATTPRTAIRPAPTSRRARYNFSGWATGNSFADFLLGLPNTVREQRNTRGNLPMDTFSNDWALFVQDDWKLNPRLTLFLGLRYEVVGVFVDRNDIYANFVPTDGGHHLVPNAQIGALLPPGAVELGRTLIGRPVRRRARADQDRPQQPQPARRLRPPSRQRATRRCCAAASASSIRPARRRARATSCRAIRSATSSPNTRPTLQQGFSTGTAERVARLRQPGHRSSISSCPDIYQYNLTLERELPGNLGARVSYIGSTMRKLLVHRDYNTVQASAVPLGNVDEDPAAQSPAAVPALRHVHGHHREPRRRPVQRAAARAAAPVQERLRRQRRLHAGRLRQQRARQRQQHDWRRAVRSRTTSRRIAVPIPTSSSTAW